MAVYLLIEKYHTRLRKPSIPAENTEIIMPKFAHTLLTKSHGHSYAAYAGLHS